MPLSLVLAESHARAIAETLLSDRWAERSSITLQLPTAFAALEPGDVIQLNDGAISHRIRLSKVQLGRPGVVKLKGVIDAAQVWDGYVAPTLGGDGSLVSPNPATRLEMLDIPAYPGDAQDALTLRFAACGVASGWMGATVMQRHASGDDETLLDITTPATMGSALTVLASGVSQLFDRINTVDVSLLGDATLASVSEASVLNGANVAVLGDEVIQFASATLINPATYRLSTLLRGRFGSEYAMGSHGAGERFVLLDAAVMPLTLPVSNAGQQWMIRAISFGESLATGSSFTTTIQANSLKPYSPVRLRAVRQNNGDVLIFWLRRARIDGGLRDAVEIPLMEQSENYRVQIFNGSTLVRDWQVSSPNVTYLAANQVTDFGLNPSVLMVLVTQLSTLVGQGHSIQMNVVVE